MKKYNLVIAAAAAIVVAAGIAISCTKDINTAETYGMPATVAAKTQSQEQELLGMINQFYRRCVAAYQYDSAGFMYICSKEDTAMFFDAIDVNYSIVWRMIDLADSVCQPQPQIGGQVHKLYVSTDTCTKCTDTSLFVMCSNIIEINRLALMIEHYDTTFNADYPITMTPLQLCIERCRLEYEDNPLMHYLCWMSCVYGKEMERLTEEYEILVQATPKP